MRQQRRNLVTSGALAPDQLPGLELRLSGTSLAGADDSVIASWADTSGKGRDAGQANNTMRPRVTISGNAVVPYSPTGRKGAAFNFGENDNMTGNLSFTYTNGLTVYAWLNETEFGGSDQVVFCPNTSSPECFIAGELPAGTAGFGDADGEHYSGTSISGVSAFHHLCWVFYPPADGTGIAKVYLNGSVIQTTTWHITAGPTAYTVGNNEPKNQPFGGSLYDLAVFSGAHGEDVIGRVRAWGVEFWGF